MAEGTAADDEDGFLTQPIMLNSAPLLDDTEGESEVLVGCQYFKLPQGPANCTIDEEKIYLKKHCKELEVYIREQDEEIKRLEEDYSNVKNDISKLQEVLKSYEKEMEENKKQIEELQKIQEQDETAIFKLKQEKEDLERKHRKTSELLEMMKKMSKVKNDRIADLEETRNQYKKWIEDISQQYKEVCRKMKKMDSIIQRYATLGLHEEVQVPTSPIPTAISNGSSSQVERDVLLLKLSNPQVNLSLLEKKELYKDYMSLLCTLKDLEKQLSEQKQAQEQQQAQKQQYDTCMSQCYW